MKNGGFSPPVRFGLWFGIDQKYRPEDVINLVAKGNNRIRTV
jgi:hypothetical protein